MSVQQDVITTESRSRGPVSTVVGALGDPVHGCRCTVTSLPSPAGDIVVLRVAGEIDLSNVGVLETALGDVLSQRPDHLVVDLAGVTFCCGRGLSALVGAVATADGNGTRYALSGASPYAERILALLWRADRLPTRYPTARVAVLAAMARQAARRERVEPAPRRGDDAPVQLHVVPEPALFAQDTDRQLIEQAQAGDTDAYRALVRRHLSGMYHSALHTLGASDDPDDVAHDIASRLYAALAVFAQVGPH